MCVWPEGILAHFAFHTAGMDTIAAADGPLFCGLIEHRPSPPPGAEGGDARSAAAAGR